MGKNPHPVPMGRSLRAATSEQQARLLKSCEEISQQIFQSRSFFESNVFLKISKVLAHGGMARPCAVMFLREKFLLWGPPAISHLLPTFGGLRMEAIWSYLLGTAAMARWCQHLNQQTPTFKKEDKSIHNFPDSQRPAGSSPQVPESYTSTWRDL